MIIYEQCKDFFKGKAFNKKISCSDGCKIQIDLMNDILTKKPIFSYFSTIYNTLISIVCGVAIGALFTDEMINFEIFHNPILFLKVLNISIIVCIVWHHYIVHTQFVAWEIGTIDTIIPFMFACLLMLSVKTLDSNSILGYALFLTAFFFLACIAYINSFISLNDKEKIISVYEKHYKNKVLAGCIYKKIINFEITCIKYCLVFTCIFFVFTCIIWEKELGKNENISIVFLLFCLLAEFTMSKLNLSHVFKTLKCASGK